LAQAVTLIPIVRGFICNRVTVAGSASGLPRRRGWNCRCYHARSEWLNECASTGSMSLIGSLRFSRSRLPAPRATS
jgi:hypothetical protein